MHNVEFMATSDIYYLFHNFLACSLHMWYSNDCSAFDENGIAAATTQDYSLKWFVTYQPGGDPICGQDCISGPDCIGSATYHDELYESYDECCALHLWWIETSRCYEGAYNSLLISKWTSDMTKSYGTLAPLVEIF